jgi:cytolethal distending toxin subunit B
MFGGRDGVESKWTKGVTQLLRKPVEADVVCLQECGALPGHIGPGAAPPWNVNIANVQWVYCTWTPFRETFNVLWIQTDPAGNRVNLALCSPGEPAGLLYANPGLAGGRPAIGFRVANPQIDVFTLHAFSGNGNDAPGLIQNIDGVVNGIPLNFAWCAAGDFNREPGTWVPPAGAILAPNAITRPASNAEYDYCVQFPVPQMLTEGYVITGLHMSDHEPVVYDV